MSSRQEMRVVVGFIVQPIIAALFGFVTFRIVEATGRPFYGGSTPDMFSAAVAFALGTGFVGLLVAVFAALPVFVWLVRRGPITPTKALVSGALLGNLPTAGILVFTALRAMLVGSAPDLFAFTYGTLGAIRATVFGTAIGLACAAVFWRIAGRHLQTR